MAIAATLNKVGVFGKGMWRYWRRGQPEPDSNYVVQKLYALTDGRSNDVLFRLLESKRRESNPTFPSSSILTPAGASDPSIAGVARSLKQDGIAVLPYRLPQQAIQSLYDLSLANPARTITLGPLPSGKTPGAHATIPVVARGELVRFDPSHPRHAVYETPRDRLLEDEYLQRLLCDSYLLACAARYLGVFPVVTKPDMWWDTDHIPDGLRPRPYHTDSGCLRWLKVGINLTETTLDTPHFVYVNGSHNPNKATRPLTKRLVSRMNLSDAEVNQVCPDRVTHITGPAGTITLCDTRGIHKGELSRSGNRLILYFGLEGSAFNNIDQPVPLHRVGVELRQAIAARPFSYQFFRAAS